MSKSARVSAYVELGFVIVASDVYSGRVLAGKIKPCAFAYLKSGYTWPVPFVGSPKPADALAAQNAARHCDFRARLAMPKTRDRRISATYAAIRYESWKHSARATLV